MAPLRFHDDIPLVRLIVVLVLFGTGAALLTVGARPGEVPGGDWYTGGRQRLILADLSFRVGQALEWVAREWTLPLGDPSREFEERAVAEYERQGLAAPPSPPALQRLGLIYGTRGYALQAQEVLSQAAALDDRNAPLLFAMAALFDPQTPLERIRSTSPAMLRQQESWLGDLAVSARATRLGDPAEVQSATVIAEHHTRHFAANVLIIGAGYGLLALIGAVLIVRAGWVYLFTTRRRQRARPWAMVSWGALEALEGGALLCFAMAAVAVGMGFAFGALAANAPVLLRLGLAALQYLLMCGIALALVWLRVPGTLAQKLAALGWRTPWSASLLVTGLGAYGVLLCCLALVAAVLPAQVGPALLGGAAVMRPILGEALRSPLTGILVFVFVAVMVPLLEETLFRGFIFAGLRRQWPLGPAVVGSAVLFAALHHSAEGMLPIAVIGVVLALVYERSRSLVPAVICHGLHNLLILVLLAITQ